MADRHGWVSEIQAIVFDLDNTLYDRDANVRSWLDRIFAGNPALAAEAAAYDNCGFIPRSDFYDWILQRVDWAGSAREVKARFQVAVLENLQPDPEINRLVRKLARRFVLGVLTNGESDYQLAKFRSLGLEDCFHASRVVATETLGVHKPEAAAFQAILAVMGVPARNTLFVGDNPLNDIVGAAAVGMKTCWIQLRPEHDCPVPPDLQVRSILELESLFEGAESPA